MTDQPEALRVAEHLELYATFGRGDRSHDAARLLREQHAEIERLREQLRLANIDALNETAENEALRAAVLAEREACARVCEETTASWSQYIYNSGCIDCAIAIRARGYET